VAEEVGSQHFWYGECPHLVADRLEHLVAQQGGKLRRPLGSTRRAEAAPTAAARHEVLVLTRRAPDPGEGCFEPSAVQVALDDVVYEAPPEAVALLEALLPQALCLVVECLDKAIQGRPLWLACPKEADSGTLCGQGEAPSLSQRGGAQPGWTNLRRAAAARSLAATDPQSAAEMSPLGIGSGVPSSLASPQTAP